MPASDSQRILVRGVNWLGDAVMTTPALLRLREARPRAHITLLTHAKLRDLWRGHPAIDAVETFDSGESAWSVGRKLHSKKFDLGLLLPNSPRSAFELWLARIPERVGYARPWRNWLLTQKIPQRPGAVAMQKPSPAQINRLIAQNQPRTLPPPAAHHLFQYLQLTAALGAKVEPLPPQLAVPETAVAEFLAKFKIPAATKDSPLFGLNAGAAYGPAKRWPEERFTRAAIQIQRLTQCRWLICGSKSESAAAGRIAAQVPQAFNLAGATTLGELCAALKLCRVLLTNDSGPMHVAAALGAPVVVPFGSTSPELTGPGLPGDPRHRLLRAEAACAPCFLRACPIDFRCMNGITVDAVVKAVMEVTGQTRGS
jgi:heptosyltransferase-2